LLNVLANAALPYIRCSGKSGRVKKWWIGVAVFTVVLATLIVWGDRPSRAITVDTYGGFKVYDVQYFPSTNRAYYWRCAWRDVRLWYGGTKFSWRWAWRDVQSLWYGKAKYSKPGPALVVYSSQVGPGPTAMLCQLGGGFAANRSECDFFGDRLVTTFFFGHGPMTNGVYELMFDRTNVVADIMVNFKN
jgi:hypothetical protein